jgi:large subunit ribosomal protein L23
MSRLGEKLKTKTPELLLKRPHVTEKVAGLSSDPHRLVYVFEVAREANKVAIKKAIIALYKVAPRRVNIVNVPSKKIFLRGKIGARPGYKKAIVYLKKGDKIELT